MKKMSLMSGTAHPELAESIAGCMGVELQECLVESFPDDELHVRVAEPQFGRDVYLVQPTGPPVGRHMLELLLMADACRRAGAVRITAVIPYFGYARQDRRTGDGEPVGAVVVADTLRTRVDRIIAVHLHNPAIEGLFGLPVEHLFPTRLIADSLRQAVSDNAVLVAPDLGAAKLVENYAALLDLPVAYVHKERFSGKRVEARRIIGDVAGRLPVLVDDMISTGGTMVSAIEAMRGEGCRTPITVAATHALPDGEAMDRFAEQPVGEIIVTNSLKQPPERQSAVRIVDIAELIAEAIKRLHS